LRTYLGALNIKAVIEGHHPGHPEHHPEHHSEP
jgi:hypothetical protein